MNTNLFGGDWTEKKLLSIKKYLSAYTKIFTKNERAQFFKTIYIDAFAGSGYRSIVKNDSSFQIFADNEVEEFYDGSAKIALQTQPGFNQYIFIEKDEKRFLELNKLKTEFPSMRDNIIIVNQDANQYLKTICATFNWEKLRAVLFLDPYGMEVEWDTIKTIAGTKAIDMWLLFPLGVAVNRLLKKDAKIKDAEKRRLNNTFGDENWQTTFYIEEEIETLFGSEKKNLKVGDFSKITEYFINRLKTIFEGVSENPLPLCNSKNNPLYLLCFATGNKKGTPTALKIANNILQQR